MSTVTAVQVNGLKVSVSSGFSRKKTKTILHDLDFTVETGKITGLLGPSGSGKTTLMRAIVGVQNFDGTLEVFDQPAGAASLRGKIGYVTQNASVYHDLSVIDNLKYFGALAKGTSTPRAPEKNSGGLRHRRSCPTPSINTIWWAARPSLPWICAYCLTRTLGDG
ncbi:MAG: ATP-binding cassette domain-containing protein [Corynebacterium glutamicum]|nr:ATP-binding cassette domain-containing protein [Corynebacterium glutamicum]